LAKSVQLGRARRRLREALARIAETRTLAEAQLTLNGGETVVSELLKAALQEVRLSGEKATDEGIKERAASRFSEIARAEARTMRQGLAILATIGATSPFVGLFGTVWGIMNSFIGISKAQTTNLAVVAPGIAEALLATAIGLVAAIPAVIIYNHFSRTTKGYLEFVGRGSGAVGRLLSRDLDRVRSRLSTRAAE
jgi:biopolymer transport protein ExbB